jgi:hypothetical protein
MAIELELGASRLKMDGEELSVSIPAAILTAKQWLRLMKRLGNALKHLKWLHIPFQVTQQTGARWKEILLDVFSFQFDRLPGGDLTKSQIGALDSGDRLG